MKKILLILLVCMAAQPAGVLAQEDSVEVRSRAVVRFEFKKAQPLATVSSLEGDVFIRRAGGVVWERLAIGQELMQGQTIKTLPQASVELLFKDSSRMRLGSSTEVALSEGVDSQSVQNSILSLTKGKLWADIQPKTETEKTIIMAGPSIMDSRSGSTFLEMSAEKNVCMDTFNGVINVRSAAAPADSVEVGPSKRVKINPADNAISQSQIAGATETFADNYSCMERAVEAAQIQTFVELQTGDSEAKDDVYVLHAYGTVSFSSGTAPVNSGFVESQGVTVFLSDDSAKPAAATDGGSQQVQEYQDIVISSRVIMMVVKPETKAPDAATSTVAATTTAATAKTEDTPTTTTTTTTTSTTTPTTDTTTTTTTTTTTSEPANTTTTTTTADTTTTTQPVDTVTTTTPEPCVVPPEAVAVAVSGDQVASGGSKDIISQTCEIDTITISGQAVATCGTVSTVQITANGTSVTAQGKSPWTASYTPKADGTYKFEITVTDTDGNRSETYSFEITFTRDEPEPAVAIQLIGGADAAGAYSGLSLNRSNLENGKLVITGSASAQGAGCLLKTVEVSLDGGSSWKPVSAGSVWTYEFTPSAGTYNITARAADSLGKASPDLNAIETSYSPLTDEDILRQLFETMAAAYKDRNSSGFMDNVSNAYSTNYDSIENFSNLNTALDSKFSAYPSIYLRYRVDTVIVSGTSGRVAFSWDADQATTGYSHYGTFIYAKEDAAWKLNTVDDSNSFLRYTAQAGSLTMSAEKTILIANETDSTTITVEARDSANNLLRDGSSVSFTTTTGSLSSQTATTTLGKASVTFTAGSSTGAAIITATTGGVSASISLTLKTEHAPLPPP